MRFFGRAHQNAEVREMPGVATIYCGLDYAAFNAGVLSQPISGEPGVLEQRIEDPATYFAGRKLRWSYWYCNDFIGKGLMRRARSMLEQHGMIELTDAPGMIAEKLAPVTRSLPAIDVKPVADTNTRAAFAHLTSVCFDVPWSICREVYGTDRAWNGTFRGWVGYANGAAVATTAVVVAGGVAGIYSVGTLPSHRNRGYAEALMRNVLDRVRVETGIERTVLQSTRSGYNLYRKLGYRLATSYTVYITD